MVDTISRFTPKTPQAKSFYSTKGFNNNKDFSATLCDPNQLEQRMSERKARRLNPLVDGNYGKRMMIPNRDKH